MVVARRDDEREALCLRTRIEELVDQAAANSKAQAAENSAKGRERRPPCAYLLAPVTRITSSSSPPVISSGIADYPGMQVESVNQ